ncbi:MAG: hypothetical protein AB7F28_05720 [Candidatus Margulisiibacteriota bacterium]
MRCLFKVLGACFRLPPGFEMGVESPFMPLATPLADTPLGKLQELARKISTEYGDKGDVKPDRLLREIKAAESAFSKAQVGNEDRQLGQKLLRWMMAKCILFDGAYQDLIGDKLVKALKEKFDSDNNSDETDSSISDDDDEPCASFVVGIEESECRLASSVHSTGLESGYWTQMQRSSNTQQPALYQTFGVGEKSLPVVIKSGDFHHEKIVMLMASLLGLEGLIAPSIVINRAVKPSELDIQSSERVKVKLLVQHRLEGSLFYEFNKRRALGEKALGLKDLDKVWVQKMTMMAIMLQAFDGHQQNYIVVMNPDKKALVPPLQTVLDFLRPPEPPLSSGDDLDFDDCASPIVQVADSPSVMALGGFDHKCVLPGTPDLYWNVNNANEASLMLGLNTLLLALPQANEDLEPEVVQWLKTEWTMALDCLEGCLSDPKIVQIRSNLDRCLGALDRTDIRQNPYELAMSTFPAMKPLFDLARVYSNGDPQSFFTVLNQDLAAICTSFITRKVADFSTMKHTLCSMVGNLGLESDVSGSIIDTIQAWPDTIWNSPALKTQLHDLLRPYITAKFKGI